MALRAGAPHMASNKLSAKRAASELNECWRLEHLAGETTPTCTSPQMLVRTTAPFSPSLRRLPPHECGAGNPSMVRF
jgi:hypothetical protein